MQILDPSLFEPNTGPGAMHADVLAQSGANIGLIKKDVDTWLNEVSYGVLNEGHYLPSVFAIKFMNFIKLVNGAEGEQNLTPVVHLAMLDQMAGTKQRIANLCFRGAAKTTLFFEYLVLYLAVFGEIDGFGKIEGMIYVSDSMDNGVKSARKNIEFRWQNSDFLQEWLPDAKFTDNYLEFKSKEGNLLGVKMFGAKALSLDSVLYLAAGGTTTMGDCQVGDQIMGADGKPTQITTKSEVFHKPMYELVLDDGRKLKVGEDHLNQVHVKSFKSAKTFSTHTLVEKTLTTLELLQEPMFAVDPKGSRRPLLWVQNNQPMEWSENQDLLLDPYTVGVLIGDGSMNRKTGGSAPVVLTGHETDWPTLEREIPYAFGKVWRDTRHPQTISRTVLGIQQFVTMHGLDCHGSGKRVPHAFLYGSIAQRLALLQGLMDTDGTCTQDGKPSFCSASKGLVEDVMWLSRSLGGEARWIGKGNARAYQCSVRLDMPLFRLERKLVRQRPLRNDKMAIVAISRIAEEPSQCIAVDNAERQFVANDFFRTHNTGLRGTKIFGKRPTLAVLDDLVSDEDAKSKAAMETIRNTVYRGVDYALHPKKRKIVFNGTPFNKGDILYEAVESGGWHVNVWPVCEVFPCSREDFRGAWEDRFDYDYVRDQYQVAIATGELASFNQELMLRITSVEDRLIQDAEIRWYSRINLLKNRHKFNFYITTDFATKAKQTSDFSVISVWAYNANGDWFWVDGICVKQLMDKTIADLFRLVQMYKPQAVGIETTGQQYAFITWIQNMMMDKNIWFTFAPGKNGEPGIMPDTDKMSRFNLVAPLFKAGKMYFPLEMKATSIMGEAVRELQLATNKGFKSKHDDFLDTISMLMYLVPWKPSDDAPPVADADGVWGIESEEASDESSMSSYIV